MQKIHTKRKPILLFFSHEYEYEKDNRDFTAIFIHRTHKQYRILSTKNLVLCVLKIKQY